MLLVFGMVRSLLPADRLQRFNVNPLSAQPLHELGHDVRVFLHGSIGDLEELDKLRSGEILTGGLTPLESLLASLTVKQNEQVDCPRKAEVLRNLKPVH